MVMLTFSPLGSGAPFSSRIAISTSVPFPTLPGFLGPPSGKGLDAIYRNEFIKPQSVRITRKKFVLLDGTPQSYHMLKEKTIG